MFNRRRMVFCCGQGAGEENSLAATRRLEQVFLRKGIRARMDYWGFDVDHSWFWWNQQMPYFLPYVLGGGALAAQSQTGPGGAGAYLLPLLSPTPPSHPGSGCSTLKRTLIEKKRTVFLRENGSFCVGEIFRHLLFFLYICPP